MIDNVNPNNQFHPYQPMNEIPAIERQQGGLNGILGGILGRGREYARAKPGVVLGGLAALVIGAGLLRRRA
jgi:hypothetical protein